MNCSYCGDVIEEKMFHNCKAPDPLIAEVATLRVSFDLLKSNAKQLQGDCIRMADENDKMKLQNEAMRDALDRVISAATVGVDSAESRVEKIIGIAQNPFTEKRECPMCLGSGEPEQGVFKMGEPCPVCGTKKLK